MESETDGQTEGRTDRPTDGQADRRTDRGTDGWMDGQTGVKMDGCMDVGLHRRIERDIVTEIRADRRRTTGAEVHLFCRFQFVATIVGLFCKPNGLNT